MPSLIDYLLSKTTADERIRSLLARPVPRQLQPVARGISTAQNLLTPPPQVNRSNQTQLRALLGKAGEKGAFGPVPQLASYLTQKFPQTTKPISQFAAGASILPTEQLALGRKQPELQQGRARTAGGITGSLLTAKPALTAGSAGIGSTLTGGMQAIQNIRKGQPLSKDMAKAFKDGALRGAQEAQTLALTGAVIGKLANTFPILQKISDPSIKATLPLANQTARLWFKNLGKTAFKRITRAALIETPIEGVTYGIRDKEEKEKLIDSISDEMVSNFVFNIGFAGVNVLADARSIAPMVKNSFESSLKTAKGQPGGLEAGFIGKSKNISAIRQELQKVNEQLKQLSVKYPTVDGITKDKNFKSLNKTKADLENKLFQLTKTKIDVSDSIKGDTYVLGGIKVPEGSRRQGLATEEVIGKLKTAQQKGLKFVEVPAQTPKGRKFFASLVKKGILDDLGKIGTSGHKYGIKPISEQFAGVKALDISPKSTVTGEIGVDEKYAFNINKPKLGLTGDAAKNLDKAVEQIRPALEGAKGEPLTNKEIIKEAQKGFMLQHVMGRQQAAEFSARLQTSREFLKKASQEPGVSQEYLNQAKAVSSAAADAGRSLRAFTIEAGDKEWFIDSSAKEKIIKDLLSIEVSMKEIIEASEGVDWSNAKQVAEFYRKFKPATLGEKLTEFRYVNMLSSPNTHQVNAFSNFLQTGIVAPIEKVISGQIDWVQSKLTGSERKYYASQGIDYTKGYWKALPEGWQAFKKHLKGEGPLTRPDIKFLPTGTSKAWRAFTTPLRALEAGDQFFRAMAKSGELESLKRVGVVGEKAQKLAADSAEYRLFRSAFDPSGKMGQNKVLQSWDKWNSAISHLRRAPGGKWIVPFLQTPTNILKQGFEYSPLGVTTVKGAGNPTEQLSKTIIGTSVYAGALAMANAGLSTWDAPTNAKEKEAFYAAGLQPYSLKFGDKWISYSRLGPLSYPIAMAAATKWSEENNADDSVMQNIGKGVAGSLRFFADQSYVRGIGDAIDAARGDEFKLQRMKTNIPSQLIPYRAFQGWLARIVDPVYRKAGSSIESLLTQVPGASKTVPPYTDPEGKPSMRQYPLMSALSPYKVTKESPKGKEFYDTFKEAQQLGKEAKTRTEGEKLIAESIWDQIKTLQPEEQRKKLAELEKQGTLNEKVFNRLKTLRKGQQRDWSPAEKKVYNLGPTEEAKFHWRRIENMTVKKQKAYLVALEKRGLLTKQTMDELVKLREKEEEKLLKKFER